MSKILNSKIVIAAGLGLTLGALSMHFITSQRPSEIGNRDLASLKPKLEFLPDAALVQSKHLAAITVRLDVPEKIPLDSQDPVELSGVVVLNQGPAQDVTIEWSLPEDVRIISGQTEKLIEQMQPGHSYPVNLVVSGFDKTDKKTITVSASAIRNGVKIGNSSLVSSRPEDSMEFIAPAMSEAAVELDTAPRQGKIIK